MKRGDLCFPVLASFAVIGMLFIVSMLVSCKSTAPDGPDASLFPDASAEWQAGFRAGVMEGILLTKDTPEQ